MDSSADQESKGHQAPTPEEAQKEFESLFAELVDVLQATVDNIDKAPEHLPEGLESKLAEIEKQVTYFQALGQMLVDNNQDGESKIQEKQSLSLQEQVCIERSEALKKEAAERLKEFPQAPPQQEEIHDNKERRKHFKRLGRNRI